MKRKGAELVQRQLKGKTFEQQTEFWQKGTKILKKLQQRLQNKS
jgi:hypothetical protein